MNRKPEWDHTAQLDLVECGESLADLRQRWQTDEARRAAQRRAAETEPEVCRVCGCTDLDACEGGCTSCVDREGTAG